jgi:hypothetical protein
MNKQTEKEWYNRWINRQTEKISIERQEKHMNTNTKRDRHEI